MITIFIFTWCLLHSNNLNLNPTIEIINNKARHNLIDAKCRWCYDWLDGAGSFWEPLGQTKGMQIHQKETPSIFWLTKVVLLEMVFIFALDEWKKVIMTSLLCTDPVMIEWFHEGNPVLSPHGDDHRIVLPDGSLFFLRALRGIDDGNYWYV